MIKKNSDIYLSEKLDFDEFYEYAQLIFSDCLKTLKSKNNDYSGKVDSMRNFKLVELEEITETEKGILVRMCDKFSRLTHLISSGEEIQVKEEKLEDTGKDLINYTVILLTWLKFKDMCLKGEHNETDNRNK